MRIEDIAELHFITLIVNVPSILKRGILSHNQAAPLKPVSVGDPLIQQRRRNIKLPNGDPLHSYANLYFHARNPMMCAIQQRCKELAVLGVSSAVLSLPGVIVSDGNASSDYTRFYPSPDGVHFLSEELVFARDWRSTNSIRYYDQKRVRCAEVLVPKLVEPDLVFGAYVLSAAQKSEMIDLGLTLVSTVEPDLFII